MSTATIAAPEVLRELGGGLRMRRATPADAEALGAFNARIHILFYYRQFDYEMGLALSGGRSGFAPQVPRLKADEREPYAIRPATPDDIPFLTDLYNRVVVGRDLITCARTPDEWRYEIEGRSPENANAVAVRIIETAEGEAIGFLACPANLWTGGPGNGQACLAYELERGISWLAVTPSVIRWLWAMGEVEAARMGKANERFIFALGAEHPVYQAYADRLPLTRPTYAWYARVADLPGFLRHVGPALEARLARSPAPGHSAELKLSFYRRGLRLVLERGRLAAIEPWQPKPEDRGSAGFPNLTFLQMLFGYRSLDELRQAYADCWTNGDETRALLMALFPKQASNLWGIN